MTPVSPGATPVVRVRDVTKRFGDLKAVDGVSFEISPGEIFGILGPNGSGKTTTIRMMCGLMTPNSGAIEVAGVDVCAQPDRVKSRIGYMSQSFGLYSDLTVLENLRFYAGVYELGERWHARTRWALTTMHLADRASDLAATLSGGNKQRLALGCAVLHEPPVLFLDEPTAGVDPAARRMFWNLIRGLAEAGTAIIVTTHYMDEAERFDRLAFLSNGRGIALGTPAEVRAGFGPGATLEDIFVRLQEQGA
jgi:ABC-2 type transport system ATP-binding protein